jgi:hypothetical protein
MARLEGRWLAARRLPTGAPGAGKVDRSGRVDKIRFPKYLTLYLALVRIAIAGCLVVASVCFVFIPGVVTRSHSSAAVDGHMPKPRRFRRSPIGSLLS